jgi:hypothetical protein
MDHDRTGPPESRRSGGRPVSRRALLRAGVAIAVTAAIGGPLAIARSSGYAFVPKAPLRALSIWQAVVVEHAAARVLRSDREGDPSVPTPRDLDVVGFVDVYVAELPRDLRRDLLRLLAYLEHVAPLARGFVSRFSRLAPSDQDRVLSALEASDVDLLRGGFEALKALLVMAYYRDPRTWAIAGYDGPWVDRPKGGWR